MSGQAETGTVHPDAASFLETLKTYIRAGYPLLYLVTAEEDRAIELISDALSEGELARRKPYVWSVSRGLCDMNHKVVDRKTGDPKQVLQVLLDFKEPGGVHPGGLSLFPRRALPVGAVDHPADA